MTTPSPSCSGREAGSRSRPELQMAQAAVSPRLPTWSCPEGCFLGAIGAMLSPAGVSSVLLAPRRQAPRQGGLRATQITR